MSVFGIISEFNPFHNGHKYLFERARAKGADAIVCVMSANAVQRGEVALTDKHERARMALLAGADLVLELPYPWCASSAEAFARCGVRIAAEFADTLMFGSECGDIEALRFAAMISADQSFVNAYKASLKGNSGAAQTYFDILSQKTGRQYSSNDILGIEYIKAAIRGGSGLSFETVRREGGAYASDKIEGGSFQSASAIRALVCKGELDGLDSYMPSESAEILKKCVLNGDIALTERLELATKLYFRLASPEALDDIAELEGGLGNRIKQAALDCKESALIDALSTKRYTKAKLRRAMLFALTGVRTADLKAEPAYVRLLGANVVGRELLSSKRKAGGIPVTAKSADIPNGESALRQRELSYKLDSVFSLALEAPRDVASIDLCSPVIL